MWFRPELWPPTSPQQWLGLRSRWAVAATLGWSGSVWWADVGCSRAAIFLAPPTVSIECNRGRSLFEVEWIELL